jgi:threonine dehydratase
LPPAITIADGIAVRAVGETTLKLVKEYVDDIVTVSEGEIANAVLLLLEIEKTVAEGAAAVPLAALVNKKVGVSGKNVGLIVTGGNIDMNLISRIIEKGLIQDGRLCRFSGANILQIGQSRGFGQTAIGETEVELTLETSGPDHIERIYRALTAENFKASAEPSFS